jgi:hypothetical protein
MKKLRFAVLVVVLMAAFPILFIAGIRGPKSKTEKQDVKDEVPVTIKKDSEVKNVSVCRYGVFPYKA